MSQCKCVDPDNQGKGKLICKLPNYRGDGNCDDENNNKGCGYDGGDCCAKTVKGGQVNKKYCKEVIGIVCTLLYLIHSYQCVILYVELTCSLTYILFVFCSANALILLEVTKEVQGMGVL